MNTSTLFIIVATSLVSLLAFANRTLMDDLIFTPWAIVYRHQWYRFVTGGLVHANWPHLVFNMLSFYLFGGLVERWFGQLFTNGSGWFLVLYATALVVSIIPTYVRNKRNLHYACLGASGAVSAVVFVGLALQPEMEIGLFILPPIIPGFVFGPLYLLISWYLSKKEMDHINHSAHLWGALYGLLFLFILTKWRSDFDLFNNFAERIVFYVHRKWGVAI